MSDRVKLENALLRVERLAREVTEAAQNDATLEVPAVFAFALVELRDALVALDLERNRIRAEAARS